MLKLKEAGSPQYTLEDLKRKKVKELRVICKQNNILSEEKKDLWFNIYIMCSHPSRQSKRDTIRVNLLRSYPDQPTLPSDIQFCGPPQSLLVFVQVPL